MLYYNQKEGRRKEMKDYIQRARCYKGYARRDVTNKTARARAKREVKKEEKNA